MTTDPSASARKMFTPAQVLFLGTLTVGVADLLDAIIFFGFRGVAPIQILHSIASGIFGRAAFRGGLPMAALGLLLHFFIAFGIVAVYYLASRRLPALRRHPLVYGPVYGLLVYAVMNFVVVPLSAAVTGGASLPVIVNGLLIHVLGVGLPSALWVSAGRPASGTAS